MEKNSGIDNLMRLGAGMQRVQERFEREKLPFSTNLTITADGGMLVEAKFMLAEVSFPIAWSHDTDFQDVVSLVQAMFDFANSPTPTTELLDRGIRDLKEHLEDLRASDPEIAEFDADLQAAREEFEQAVRAGRGGTTGFLN